MQHKNYITENGYKKLQQELFNLVTKERPELVNTINWAASNGDRSENGDYIYGKKRLREVDKRIHHLTGRIAIAAVINPQAHIGRGKIYFGAEVTLLRHEAEEVVRIVGQDEIDPTQNHISWVSPLAKLILGKEVGDYAELNTPNGKVEIEIIQINYNW